MSEVFQVQLTNEDISYSCSEEQNLLEGMTKLGVKGIPVGCRGGGCGVCKVLIIEGDYTTKKMSREHVSEEEEKEGFVLACRCKPQTNLILEVVGSMKKNIEKGANRIP